MVKISPAPYKPDTKYPPGTTLQEMINELHISKVDLAMRLNISMDILDNLFKGKYPITQDLAIKLEFITNLPNVFWLNLERNWRE